MEEEVGLVDAPDSVSMVELVVAAAALDSIPTAELASAVDFHSSVAAIHLVAADESASTRMVAAAEQVEEVRTCHSCEIS
jgi:hypothetical protein